MDDSRYGCFACTDFAGCSIVAGGVIRGIYEVIEVDDEEDDRWLRLPCD